MEFISRSGWWLGVEKLHKISRADLWAEALNMRRRLLAMGRKAWITAMPTPFCAGFSSPAVIFDDLKSLVRFDIGKFCFGYDVIMRRYPSSPRPPATPTEAAFVRDYAVKLYDKQDGQGVNWRVIAEALGRALFDVLDKLPDEVCKSVRGTGP